MAGRLTHDEWVARQRAEAARMAKHNQELRYALAHGLSLAEARRRLALEQVKQLDLELDRKRRCGTEDCAPHGAHETASAPHFWWLDQ